MQRVCKKIFFGLVFMFFLMNKSYNVLAFDVKAEQVVTKDKIWTITFNYSIALDKLAYENIIVKNSEGQKVNVILKLGEDKKSILVKPPVGGYKLGTKYELNINNKLQSIEGKNLKKSISFKFDIVSIVKINNINLSIKQGQAFTPQKRVTADLGNGISRDMDVIWDKTVVDTNKAGIYIFKGTVQGYNPKIILTLTVKTDYNQLVKASPVIARVPWDSSLYKEMSAESSKLAVVKKGTKVEVIKDKSYKWYYIKTESGKYGWIKAGNLIIPQDPATNTSRLSKEQLEGYVNIKGFKSNTKYFMWVDLDRQTVNVFEGTQGKYKFLKSMSCATGKNISPTTRGTFSIQSRGEWFFTGSSGAKNWVQWNGAYLFHSIIMYENKTVKDYTLGKRASAGCIRLSIDNSKWVYDKMSNGTTVWVN